MGRDGAAIMDLVRAWAAGAGVWSAWAVVSTLLHLWLLPLGALDTWHLRVPWVALTTLTGYTLVAFAAGRAHRPGTRSGAPVRPGRRAAAVWTLPAAGAALEAGTAFTPGAAPADFAALAVATGALAAGTALGSAADRRLRRRGDRPGGGQSPRSSRLPRRR
ncbi:hypothetical protein [Streptomonospora salina]|uniref:Uncharacterized protein n=1 Tax=Streptomonospora salina TaxID=104205 RepID=A0A841E3N5_9ACTN|nr:hypothetical protein [Streptomonospora salina]MBB5997312.1 hypothetical protein [Streptomonospora salina]